MSPGRSQASELAVEAYGRLLGFLSCYCRDLALAEEALADAFLAAVRTWDAQGVPARPEA